MSRPAANGVPVPGVRDCVQAGEKGSALLIVFVFAAMVAIMLYMEMPVYTFEARRQKEQLLIDRGNEYKHAVKLFVRKTGVFPQSIDALEDTNRMRFLRHKFKDPFTGNTDWRLLHAGPGGMVIDSKVNSNRNPALGPNANTNTNSNTNTNTNSASNSTFGSGFSSDFGSSSSTAQIVVPPVRQRPPAISASGGGTLEPPGSLPGPSAGALPPLPQTGNDLALPPSDVGATSGEPAGPTPSAGETPMQTVSNLLNNPNSPPGTTNPNSLPPTGVAGSVGVSISGRINSGGIAGVASIAHGHTIKTVNDQSDFSLWEFYYDPTKENARGVAGALPGGAGLQPGGAPQPGTPNLAPIPAVGTVQPPPTDQNSLNPNVPPPDPNPPPTPPGLMPRSRVLPPATGEPPSPAGPPQEQNPAPAQNSPPQ
ncbi:MAG: hypothetical protein JO097_03835 [Acidobacteriaceae bacterium]|nr:hypothetical protein [Acidobacteriaceae bacterium]MBV9295081.1 hypothetical protein [Acidobacteriaceae bacterium]MBV9765106.1 hypothetical protein [Acidobacteriaceae bacterium]